MNIRQSSSSSNKIETIIKTIQNLIIFCNTAVSTLDNVLTFDKLDENKLILEKQVISPLELLREVIQQYEDIAKKQNIEMRIVCLPEGNIRWLDDIEFSCDKAKVIQILRYLLSNAFKYTPIKGHITVFLENCESRGEHENISGKGGSKPMHAGMIRMSIRDTGQGVAASHQHNIFTQFVETESLSASMNMNTVMNMNSSRNTGLSLWICKSKLYINMHACIFILFNN